MKGRIQNLARSLDGEYMITVAVGSEICPIYEKLRDEPIALEIKKHRARRSLDANAYAWVLIDKIASEMSVEKEVVYKNAIRNIGGVSEIVCVKECASEKLIEAWKSKGIGWQVETLTSKVEGCINLVLYYGSSIYDTKQMSRLLDLVITEAKELGIETMPANEIERMMSLWGDRDKVNTSREARVSGNRAHG